MEQQQKKYFMTNRRAILLIMVGVLIVLFAGQSEASTVVCEITYTTFDESADQLRRKKKRFSGVQDKDELYAACEHYATYYLTRYPFHKIRTIKIELI